MLTPEHSPVRRWSTDSMPRTQRLDYWLSALQSAMWPVTEFSGFAEFSVELEEAPLGALSTCREQICAHQARRTRRDVENTVQSTFHLFMSFEQSWSLSTEAGAVRMRQGDVVLVGDGQHETCVDKGFHGIILKCPVGWVHTWLPEPRKLAGRPIRRESTWGQVLSPMVSQLTPQLVSAASVPHAVLTDQLGAILALIADQAERTAPQASLRKIRSVIRERCHEPGLTADAIALSLNIPPATLHQTLAASKLTFRGELDRARRAR